MKIEKVESLEIIKDKMGKIYEKEDQKNGVDFNFESFSYAAKDDNGEILGGIHGWRVFREIYIDELCIDDSVRGCGFGKKLLETLIKEADDGKVD